ncbi:MAG TPA: SET domain-containing protein [Jatrophihabitans sp.]|nr:SET domain-containing protein [Jatrophihabitans sp.]
MRPAEVRPSPIAGRGLFTTAAIDAGAVVLEQRGVGTLNHSCDPNLGWRSDDSLVALRDINAGDELTIDYATTVANPDFVMMCHCETYRCRQVIEGTDWQIPQLQKRYAGCWAPPVQRLIDNAQG